jgi:GH25 family lysozyme M1 (1,4-beta-N-acetylmuramidase)
LNKVKSAVIKTLAFVGIKQTATTSQQTLTPPYPIEGPDVSTWQDYSAAGQFVGIDFKLIKASRKSVRMLGIKIGEGSWDGYPEATFQGQAREGLQAGIESVFPYHYWHVEVPASQQAGYYKTRLTNLGQKMTGPLAVDIEDTDRVEYKPPTQTMTAADIKARTPTAKAMTSALKDYLDAVSQIDGRPCLWYGADWYESWFLWLAAMAGMDMGFVQLYPRWIASYTSPVIYLPYLTKIENVYIWQDTSTPGSARQMQGFPNPSRVDMNWFIKSEADFNRVMLLGAGSVTPPAELTDKQKLDILWQAHPDLWP